MHQRLITRSLAKLGVDIHFVDIVVNVVQQQEGEGDGDDEADQDEAAQDAGHQVVHQLLALQTEEAADDQKQGPSRGNYLNYRSREKII